MTRFRFLAVTAIFALGIASVTALAQGLAQSPAMGEYQAAMAKMHAGMDMKSSGDADVDFVRMMIPHHQAAVEMAQSQLKYGKDPEIRQLAQDIIAAQNKEIAQMNAWLAAHKK